MSYANAKIAVFEDEDEFSYERTFIRCAEENARQAINLAARTENSEHMNFWVDRYEHYLGLARKAEVKIRYFRRFGKEAYYECMDMRRLKEMELC